MEPTFDCPSADARHVWIKCERDDPMAAEFWCPCQPWNGCNKAWVRRGMEEVPSLHCDPACGQIWRKQVEVPTGWRILGEVERALKGDKVLDSNLQWSAVVGDFEISVKEWNAYTKHLDIYIRETSSTDEVSAELAKMAAAGRQYPNPYAVTIDGKTFDYYQVIRALEMTDDPELCHAFKKIWRRGKGQKTKAQDVQSAIESLKRWQEN